MKSLFILAGVVMMMLTGCGSESGSYSTENGAGAEVSAPGVTINEPGQVYNLPPVPAFPAQ